MPITRDINAFSPEKPETLSVNVLNVQIGSETGARPVTEAFIYDPAPMAVGIHLSFPVAPGTQPAVYLRGLRMTIRQVSEEADVEVYDDVVDEVPSSGIAFIGDTYSLAPGDRVLVDYWTTA